MFINIDVERLRHYMSRKALAAALSISIDTLNDWIHKREAIPADKLRALSQLFGCSVDYLLKERRWELETWLFIKTGILTACGIIASVAVEVLGGYDHFFKTLVFFMVIDCVTGWMAAAVFKKSKKTETGRLSSKVCFRGLAKKGCMLLIIVVAVLLDDLMQTGELARDAVIIAFIINELISILENAGHMGVKMPDTLKNSLEILGRRNPPGR